MKTCAVIIAAYKADDFINQCIASVENQKLPAGWSIDVRVGVDGCKKTAGVLDRQYYFSAENVGAYVMRNSLIYQKQSDCYSYFDADDVMKQGYLKTVLSEIDKGAHAVMTKKINCDETLVEKKKCLEKGGAITFTHEVLEMLGGYQNYRCAADTDFMERIILAGYEIININTPLYLRRIHSGQLTKSKDTAYNSEYRKRVWHEMTEARESGLIDVNPVLQDLEYIIPEKKETDEKPVYVLIRTSGRPVFFAEMMRSIKSQTYKNIITIVHTDDENDIYVEGDIIIKGEPYSDDKGTAPYNLYCNDLLDKVPENIDGWIVFMDDDDRYTGPESIENFVKNANEEMLNVARVRRWNNTIWPQPERWGTQQSFQTECFMFHVKHKNKSEWWANKAGDHYFSRKLSKILEINWIDNLIVAEAQEGKGNGQRLDKKNGDPSRVKISKVGARHAGPMVKIKYLCRVYDKRTGKWHGKPGLEKTLPLNFAKKLEKSGSCIILDDNKGA